MRTIIIYYCSWGGNTKDNYLWTAMFEDNEEIIDYNSKFFLKNLAIKNNYNYKLLKLNRKTKKLEIVEEYIDGSLHKYTKDLKIFMNKN